MSFYEDVDTRTSTGERKALEPGRYGTGKQPGLEIVSYLGCKPDKSGNNQASYLVAATRPSNEKLKAQAESNGHGSDPGFVLEPEGAAFLNLTLEPDWLEPETIAVALTATSKDKDGNIKNNLMDKALSEGKVTAESLKECIAHYREQVTHKAIAANTPEDQLEAKAEEYLGNKMWQIAINIRNLFSLQDWKNGGDKSKRDPQMPFEKLLGVEFSGTVEQGTGSTNQVKHITAYSVKK